MILGRRCSACGRPEWMGGLVTIGWYGTLWDGWGWLVDEELLCTPCVAIYPEIYL